MSEGYKQTSNVQISERNDYWKTVNLDDKMITVINVRYVEAPFHPLRLVYNLSGV